MQVRKNEAGRAALKLEQGYMRQIYQRVITLAGMMHLLYVFVFGWLGLENLTVYNIFSVLFYSIMFFFVKKDKIKLGLFLVHCEVIYFVCSSTLCMGWDCGSYLMLISMASLVYFCPYKNKYIPYLFSMAEAVVYIGLKTYITFYPVESIVEEKHQLFIYIWNIIVSFTIVLYSAFVSNISATVTKNELLIKNQDLSSMANHDQLTGLLNRRWVHDRLEEMWKDSRQEGGLFALSMCDIDDFKVINDTYGHDYGDYVLHKVAGIIEETAGSNADVCRWGGEEFVLLFQNVPRPKVEQIAEEIRHNIEQYEFKKGQQDVRITITIGLCDSTEVQGVDAIIKQADKRMYIGKHDGKNRVIISG